MKALRGLEAALLAVTLLVAVPVAAIAIDLTTDGSQSSSGSAGRMQSAPMRAGGMMATARTTGGAVDRLTIVHVQNGCHVWSNGSVQMPAMRISLHRGERLALLNQDVDMHQLVERSGPSMIMLGGPMKQGQQASLSFAKAGLYRFDTKVSPMAGMPEVATSGPDNTLRLTVAVS